MQSLGVSESAKVTTEQVRELRAAGLSYREIAARLKISPEAVRKRLARLEARSTITIHVGKDSVTVRGARDQVTAAEAITSHFERAGYVVESTDALPSPPQPIHESDPDIERTPIED